MKRWNLNRLCLSLIVAGLAATSFKSASAQTAPASSLSRIVKPNLPAKKLLEYGWDLPDSEYVRDHIQEMEKRPFDGVIFRLPNEGGRVFVTDDWKPEKLAPQLKVASDIKWNKFTDNFLSIYASSTMDWFSDADWAKVLAHAKFSARFAKTARCKGIVFDPEPYGNSPWIYARQKYAKTKSFDEYASMVRKRGNQFMNALQGEMPVMKILGFYQFSMPWYYSGHDTRPVQRAEDVNRSDYALLTPFLEGMLEAAGTQVQFIDGNEPSYYFKSALEYYEAYHVMRQNAKQYIAPELRDKFDRNVRAGQALYVDYVFNLRPDAFTDNIAIQLTPEERAQWFEHNTYYALQSSDEYVWLYSEKMNWWANQGLPPGLEQAVASARSKVVVDQSLGFDLSEILKGPEARKEAALQSNLIRRTASIKRITKGQAPVIDGRLNEAMYGEAMSLEPFIGFVNQSGAPAALEATTRAWVSYDDDNLYVAFRNSEPLMKQLVVSGESRDSSVPSGDSVEISIQSPSQASEVFHFILGPSNVQWDAVDKDKSSDTTFNPNWKSATTRGENEWTVEAAIPWRELKMEAPKPGTMLRANLARQRLAKTEYSSWSQFVSGFQEPANFGTWIFE